MGRFSHIECALKIGNSDLKPSLGITSKLKLSTERVSETSFSDREVG